ncbi:hypothetical protein ASPVEDRAFT_36704 [Aspergillus versicolor CBS 583.65]|uniref:Uncharacterized protein n=1 Tax=Aspergillus versicolor CBS 583.65 TaxID=1036611 RepID=A0A1L9P6Y7_ASPVE|nr:uncharacterized protein ASPVEDRAFT_36704 [Aspergillus versicolor CBS 583.65]OJI97287.1 hypothetical protein ASPVEDRAFT_36704 [Aspergillus versicolor CBS 583.65]
MRQFSRFQNISSFDFVLVLVLASWLQVSLSGPSLGIGGILDEWSRKYPVPRTQTNTYDITSFVHRAGMITPVVSQQSLLESAQLRFRHWL